MNEALKKFSEQLALDLKGKLSSEKTAEFIKTVKASGDDRTFEVIMSTSDEDRQGDSLDQSGWDFKYFDMNPVVLWAHDYSSFPIGVVEDIRIEGDKAIATGKFAPAGVNPEADMACALYQEKILRTVSPGYIQNDDGTRELLELSFCPVPAGRYALSLRQAGRLGVSTRDLVTKGFFYEEPAIVIKTEQAGDSCQMEDGSPGVLAEDSGSPGKLVCVPAEQKESKSNENMNELEKKLKAEQERHKAQTAEHIDNFADAAPCKEKLTEEEDQKEPEQEDELEKTIGEFTVKMDSENEAHLEKCMKAIDDEYETMGREPNKSADHTEIVAKSIEDFKSDIEAEHLNHVKAFHKAIDEFGTKAEDGEVQKALDEFTKAMGTELERHEKCHMDMCKAEFGEGEDDGKGEKKKGAVADQMSEDEVRQAKYQNLDRAYSVFYAFTSAYMEDEVAVGDFETLLDEAVALMKDVEAEVKGKLAKHYVAKSGRVLSGKTKEVLKAIMKSLEDHHAEHGKSTDEITAALKSLVDSGGGGEEPKPEEKTGAAPKPRSSTSGATTELEAYLFNQRLMRQVKTAVEGVLKRINPKIKELTSRDR